ncbi:MAG: BamA/TamA family outer membrane protein [Sphingobacteriales bacterium]
MKTRKYLLCIAAVLSSLNVFSQQDSLHKIRQTGGTGNSKTQTVDSAKQTDLVDIIKKILDKKASPEKRELPKKANFSFVPYGGYTLSTGFTVNVSGNVSFFTDAGHQQNLSVLAADIGYDSKIQKMFRSRSEIWTNKNGYKIVSDMRYEIYPTDTYGLGTFTTLNEDRDIDYRYLRLYETVLKKITTDFYAGIGYNFDYHYNITTIGNSGSTAVNFTKYGRTSSSKSSGIDFAFLYDNRKNPLNPPSGAFASVIYRENFTFIASNANWRSLQLDIRKYIKLSSHSNNVLAIWGIAAFTSGHVPYLDLPNTGGDMYNNSGRGYAIGRFRGKNELYIEGEYRFGLTKNGLLGAVIFANGESFSELKSNAFEGIAPAAGTGIRIKLNKHSNSNICIDYGYGTGGSRGFFVNLGEVF